MRIGFALVVLTLIFNQCESILVKRYGKKYNNGGLFFNAVICFFAMSYFFITDKGNLDFHNEIVIYGIINSVSYAMGFYSVYVAFKTGSFGLTRLFSSFSMVISVFYGVIFLDEPTSVLTYIGVSMVLLSLLLMNYQKQRDSQKITFRWSVCVLLTVLSNAAIAITGRMQFEVFGDVFKNEFLIISLGGAAILLFILGLIFEKEGFKSTIKYGMLYGAGAGIFNGIGNLLTLITYKYLPISLTEPVKAGLGMVFSFLVSVLCYREKFNRRQTISVIVGALAVVLMSV